MIMCSTIDFDRGSLSSGPWFVPRVVPGHGSDTSSPGQCHEGGP